MAGWIVNGVDEFGGSPAGGENFEVGFATATTTELNRVSLLSSSASGGSVSATYQTDAEKLIYSDTLTDGAPGSGRSKVDETLSMTDIVGSPSPTFFFTSMDGGQTDQTDLAPVTGQDQLAFTWQKTLNPGDILTVTIEEIISGGAVVGGTGSTAVHLPSPVSATFSFLSGLGISALVRKRFLP